VDIKEIWEADRLRTERVRSIEIGRPLDEALSKTLGHDVAGPCLWGASTMRSASISAFQWFSRRHPDRVNAFAQRLLDEVAPWATTFNSAIELDVYEGDARTVRHELGTETVLRILTAEPAAIVRAIILSLPER
jgi:hypothetical protein